MLKNFLRRSGKSHGKKRGAVFQTVDVGAGTGEWIKKKARRFPSRTYVAVDPQYSLAKSLSFLLLYPSVRKRVKLKTQLLSKRGVVVEPKTLVAFLKTMVKRKQKTKNFNIDMPTLPFEDYTFEFLFMNISRLLLPNGKIYVKSEMQSKLGQLKRLAERYGLKVSAVKPLPEMPVASLRTATMRALVKKGQHPIYSLVITYGLKKARKDTSNQH